MTTTTVPAPAAAATRRRFTVDEFLAMDQAGIFHPDERLGIVGRRRVGKGADWNSAGVMARTNWEPT